MTRSELLTNIRMSLQLGRRCVSKWINVMVNNTRLCVIKEQQYQDVKRDAKWYQGWDQ